MSMWGARATWAGIRMDAAPDASCGVSQTNAGAGAGLGMVEGPRETVASDGGRGLRGCTGWLAVDGLCENLFSSAPWRLGSLGKASRSCRLCRGPGEASAMLCAVRAATDQSASEDAKDEGGSSAWKASSSVSPRSASGGRIAVVVRPCMQRAVLVTAELVTHARCSSVVVAAAATAAAVVSGSSRATVGSMPKASNLYFSMALKSRLAAPVAMSALHVRGSRWR